MGRSGYSDNGDNWSLIRWRGQVASAIRGKRGRLFLKELLCALEAMPEKRLITNKLIDNGEVCTLGSLGVSRGVDMTQLDPHDYDTLADKFGIARQLIQEIEYQNDEEFIPFKSTPEERWKRMHDWVKEQIK